MHTPAASGKVIEQALADKGTVLIPAFSIGRTQELLYELEAIIHSKTKRLPAAGASLLANSPSDAVNPINWPELPIILDSPPPFYSNKSNREVPEALVAASEQSFRNFRH